MRGHTGIDQRQGSGQRNEIGLDRGRRVEPAPANEGAGPALAPFLRHRRGDRWWRVGLGFLYVPAIILVITVEGWMGIPQWIIWTSLGVFFVGFIAFLLLADRLMSGD